MAADPRGQRRAHADRSGADALLSGRRAELAGWVLSRRGPLYARDRVIAGGLALAFSTAATIGIALIAILRGDLAMLVIAVPAGLVLVCAATALLVRARAHHAALLRRKRELQRGDR